MNVTNAKVIRAFIDGDKAESGSMTSNELRGNNNSIQLLYSYNTVIAYRWNGFCHVTTHKYSVTTSKQRHLLLRELLRELPTVKLIHEDLDGFSALYFLQSKGA